MVPAPVVLDSDQVATPFPWPSSPICGELTRCPATLSVLALPQPLPAANTAAWIAFARPLPPLPTALHTATALPPAAVALAGLFPLSVPPGSCWGACQLPSAVRKVHERAAASALPAASCRPV